MSIVVLKRRSTIHFYFFPEVEVARLTNAVRRFVRDEEGAALAEYGILVAFIAIVAITAVTFFGSRISSKFSQLATSFT
jgi:pilus assembly protein Flp/PilA